MIKTLMAAAAAAAFGLPMMAQASAADDNLVIAQRNPTGFDRLDRNRDGYISRDEANGAAELDTRFSELDRNNDGKLSRDEYNALNAGASGATSSPSRSGMNASGTAPGKGPGAQEPATRSGESGAGGGAGR